MTTPYKVKKKINSLIKPQPTENDSPKKEIGDEPWCIRDREKSAPHKFESPLTRKRRSTDYNEGELTLKKHPTEVTKKRSISNHKGNMRRTCTEVFEDGKGSNENNPKKGPYIKPLPTKKKKYIQFRKQIVKVHGFKSVLKGEGIKFEDNDEMEEGYADKDMS